MEKDPLGSKSSLRMPEVFSNTDPQGRDIDEKINGFIGRINRMESIHPAVVEYFKDPALFNALTDQEQYSDEEILVYMENSCKFANIISVERTKAQNGDENGLFGERIIIGASGHADGRIRPEESGYKVNVEYLNNIGIDPTKVLFYRVTRLSDVPRLELYWTSDYFETVRGLRMEISPEQRKNSVILVANLETINQNGGLIQDINDDGGVSVRQIGDAPFDQGLVVATIPHS